MGMCDFTTRRNDPLYRRDPYLGSRPVFAARRAGQMMSTVRGGSLFWLLLLSGSTPLTAQVADHHLTWGVLGGAAHPVANGRWAQVLTLLGRWQQPVISFEIGLPVYKYQSPIYGSADPALPPIAFLTSVASIPGFDVQLKRRVYSTELFVGAGGGWAVPIRESSLRGSAVHAVAGLRVHITKNIAARLEIRPRWVNHRSRVEFSAGVDGWLQ
jgi:hypothetical protein